MKRKRMFPPRLPSMRSRIPVDRLQTAVLAAMRREAVRERLARNGLARDLNGRSEK
jgi:hypothetical protein